MQTTSENQKKETRNKSGRKAAHNEVESRRKLKISQLVSQLSEMVGPECHCGKETQTEVLEKVLVRIKELQKSNNCMQESTKQYCHDRDIELERKLQRQLISIMAEHIDLVFQYTQYTLPPPVDENRVSTVPLPPSPTTVSSERYGRFGVADLLDSYDHSNSNTTDTPHVRDTTTCHMYSSATGGNSVPVRDLNNTMDSSITSWGGGSGVHHPSFQPYMIPPTVPSPQGNMYYQESLLHPTLVPPQHYIHHHDHHQSSNSSTVWRPYNDQQHGSGGIPSSTQTNNNSSFLVEQLLEKLL